MKRVRSSTDIQAILTMHFGPDVKLRNLRGQQIALYFGETGKPPMIVAGITGWSSTPNTPLRLSIDVKWINDLEIHCIALEPLFVESLCKLLFVQDAPPLSCILKLYPPESAVAVLPTPTGTPIQELHLSTVIESSLLKEGIATVDQLLDYVAKDELWGVRGIGKARKREIMETLNDLGLV